MDKGLVKSDYSPLPGRLARGGDFHSFKGGGGELYSFNRSFVYCRDYCPNPQAMGPLRCPSLAAPCLAQHLCIQSFPAISKFWSGKGAAATDTSSSGAKVKTVEIPNSGCRPLMVGGASPELVILV